MASSNKAPFHKFDVGITGKEFDRTHADTKNVKRIDESWPEDEFGAKVFHGPNYGRLLETMGSGDITMMANGDPIDPPRYGSPSPGSREFGERARERRERLRSRARDEGRPEDPEDAAFRDIVSGEETSMKRRRKELEDETNF